jgi:glycosyltransferase involved in cell wall biosynthesis
MQKLLIIGYTWPEPKTTGAGVRMMQLIHAFLKNNFQITFASAAEKTEYSEDLKPLGIQEKYIKLNDSSFDKFVKKLHPNVVVFDRFYTEEQFGWRVAETCPKAVRILDTEDLHFLRFARKEALKSNLPVNYKNSTFAFREIASIYRCDLSLIISKAEIEILQNEFKIDSQLLHYLPFFTKKTTKEYLPPFEDRQNFVFIGNYKHQPNVDAVVELQKNIWPLISKALPETELHCYGAYANEQITQLHKPGDRFFIKGWAKDAQQLIQNARVMLAPLRFGAGLKGKLVDAMRCGTPFVSTSIGIEGFESLSDFSTFTSDDIQGFSEIAGKLYIDKKLWMAAQNQGFEMLSHLLSNNHEAGFFERLKNFEIHLELHRQNNFTGAMLRHHMLNSTRYLSKWIEEKNNKK